MSIALRKEAEIEGLRRANRLVAQTFEHISPMIKIGTTANQINQAAEDFIVSNGGRPSFKGLYGFPGAVCTSVNEVIIHGIPDDRPLENGDIIGVDIGTEVDGWYGDAAKTYLIGDVSEKDRKLVEASKEVLYSSISKIKVGMRFKELSQILEEEITSRGYIPLKNYCGHGIGRKPHEEPSILNYVEGNPKQGPKIKNGMVFCIEPMICQKEGDATVLDDKWSVVSSDGLNGSHYEHTVAVVNGKAEILSKV
ncbi:MAG: type I methionyl aminopeptidase [Campylobacterales bacterium]|nr:type I methionyl aminopeptidase [Campylobacterales bacterium]